MVNTSGLMQAAFARSSAMHAAALALGSNLGNRVRSLTEALRLLQGKGNVQVGAVSCLYESAPAYVTDQPRFLNAAALVLTHLEPLQLLREIKDVEAALGRDLLGGQRFGPRPVDLDIIFYDGLATALEDPLTSQWLQIPHPRWQERTFVTAPLADLADAPVVPWDASLLPTTQGGWGFTSSTQQQDSAKQPAPCIEGAVDVWDEMDSVALKDVKTQLQLAKQLWQQQQGSTAAADLQRVVPLANGECWQWSQRTQTMAVLNVTPDSFSDGGVYNSTDVAVQRALELAQHKVDIIDIGGQSTRPGSTLLAPAEECARVVPLIRRLRELPELDGVMLSIDTFFAEVAAAAVEAGADVVNDVSGGLGDDNMMHTVASLGVPYMMMHMRGTPQTMTKAPHTHYNDVCLDVAAELTQRANQAFQAGVLPWSVVLDPGLSFAKTQEHNLQLVAGLQCFKSALPAMLQGQPILLGASRKSFLGRITGRSKATDRDFATAAIHAIAVRQGANILRGHNPMALVDAATVADAVAHVR